MKNSGETGIPSQVFQFHSPTFILKHIFLFCQACWFSPGSRNWWIKVKVPSRCWCRWSIWPWNYQWPRSIIPYSRCPGKLHLLLSECSWKHWANPWCFQFLCKWWKQSIRNPPHQHHYRGKDFGSWTSGAFDHHIPPLDSFMWTQKAKKIGSDLEF